MFQKEVLSTLSNEELLQHKIKFLHRNQGIYFSFIELYINYKRNKKNA